MTDENKTEAPAPEAAAVSEAPVADDRVAALEAEVGGLRDQVLRTLAEMENLRRRTEREIADSRAYAVTAFARDVVGVGDNLARALAVLPADVRAEVPDTVRSLIDGVELTERELLKALEKHGVRRVDPVGEKFDPNFHQAMFEVPNSEVPSGTVVQVVQAGYKIGERVLRPALVGVGRGGPKAVKTDEAETPKVDKTV